MTPILCLPPLRPPGWPSCLQLWTIKFHLLRNCTSELLSAVQLTRNSILVFLVPSFSSEMLSHQCQHIWCAPYIILTSQPFLSGNKDSSFPDTVDPPQKVGQSISLTEKSEIVLVYFSKEVRVNPFPSLLSYCSLYANYISRTIPM